MFQEVLNKMAHMFGFGSNGWSPIAIDANNHLYTSEPASFCPFPGTLQVLAVTNVSARTATNFIPGKEYIFYSTVPCHVVLGDTVVTATATDPHVPEYMLFPFVPTVGSLSEMYLAVLKSTVMIPVPADGQLFVFRSGR